MGGLWIAHPEIDVPSLVEERPFVEVWKNRGFEKVAPDLAAASAALGRDVTDEASLPVSYVRELVAERRAAVKTAPKKKTNTAVAPASSEPGEGDQR